MIMMILVDLKVKIKSSAVIDQGHKKSFNWSSKINCCNEGINIEMDLNF